jgi:hypothetical protein
MRAEFKTFHYALNAKIERNILDAARPGNWLLSKAEQKGLPPYLQRMAQDLREAYRKFGRHTIHARMVNQHAAYDALLALEAVHGSQSGQLTGAEIRRLNKVSAGLGSFAWDVFETTRR